jgi:copper chaperone NosL
MKKLSGVSRIIVAISALILIVGYFVPLWQILMWAPQYPEWLTMKIWINNITGDVRTINALNHYIGMKFIEVDMFPEFAYMVYLLGAIIGIGLTSALIGKRWTLWIYLLSLAAAGVAALIDFYIWGYDYGHNLNPEAPIQVPGMTYQPPLIGTKQLLNFTAYSGPDIGGWVFVASGVLVVLVFVYELYVLPKREVK